MATTGNTTRLYMVFGLADGRDMTISLLNPKDELDEDDVKAAMQSAITGQVLKYGGSLATAIKDAYLRSVDTTDLNVES